MKKLLNGLTALKPMVAILFGKLQMELVTYRVISETMMEHAPACFRFQL